MATPSIFVNGAASEASESGHNGEIPQWVMGAV